jgi:hypothetical protein
MAEPDEGLYRFPSLLRVEHAMFLLVLSGPGFPPQPLLAYGQEELVSR